MMEVEASPAGAQEWGRQGDEVREGARGACWALALRLVALAVVVFLVAIMVVAPPEEGREAEVAAALGGQE